MTPPGTDAGSALSPNGADPNHWERGEVIMPLFEYDCRTCGHRFEALVLGSRQPVCPKCKSENLEKRVSAIGFAGSSSGSFGGRAAGCGTGGGGG